MSGKVELRDNSESLKPCSGMEEKEMEVVESLEKDDVSEIKPSSKTDEEKEMEDVESLEEDDVSEIKPSSETDEEKEMEVVEPNIDTVDKNKVDEKIEKTPIFRYMIRVPRCFDDKLEEQIEDAQLKVNEKIRERDTIRVEIEAQKVTCKEYNDKFEAAKLEVRAAYNALQVKRKEVDSVHVGLNSIKNATSVKEIDYRVRSMQYMIEHETVSLKEEKEAIKEIKQLKLQRQNLCKILQESSKEFAVDQREELENNLQVLKQDLDSARDTLGINEGKVDDARKIYYAEKEKLRGMQEQVRCANVVQQEAYRQLQKLKNYRYDRNKYFRKYKDDARKAEVYVVAGDKEALHSHCVNQVEKVMELWNKNDEFRNAYCRCNTWSTWKRLGSSKVLGLVQPDTKKNASGIPKVPVMGKPVLPSETEKTDEKSANTGKKNHETAALKAERREEEAQTEENETEKSAVKRHEIATLKAEEEERREAEKEKTEEEKEKERKEAEVAAIKYREQLLLEARIKAREAEERKKRNAQKAQAQAELTARKEAEEKEKKKAKKERRKARKNAAKESNDEVALVTISESAVTESSTTITQDPEIEEAKTVSKGPQKDLVAAKKAKAEVIPRPPPNRMKNRNKKKMQTWMWVVPLLLTAATSMYMSF